LLVAAQGCAMGEESIELVWKTAPESRQQLQFESAS